MENSPPHIQVREDRVVLVDGLRSPFSRSWTDLNGIDAVELSTRVARELIYRNELRSEAVDHVVWGTVVAVPRSPNVAREVALNLGMYRTPGFTVTRACATGLQSVASAAQLIREGAASVVLAGGVDITSDAPVPHRKRVIDTLQAAQRKKGMDQIATIASLKLRDFLPKPPGITEPYTGLSMGEHAEEMAQNFSISRSAQEAWAMESHRKAGEAWEAGQIAPGVIAVQSPKGLIERDNLIRPDMKAEKLARLRPVFDRKNGTITAATSSALTDGAACVLVMRESRARELGLTPRAALRSYAFPALDPRENMLLGNVYACPEALDRAGVRYQDLDLLEIHEAFAAQVLSNMQCFEDEAFFQSKLEREQAMGQLDPSKVNIWGGSMAYGHPFAATGGRLLIHLMSGLEQVDGSLGMATACAAGGLGSAMILERI